MNITTSSIIQIRCIGDPDSRRTPWDAKSAIEVPFRTIDGEARAGNDYDDVSGFLSWSENDVEPKVVSIPLKTDSSVG